MMKGDTLVASFGFGHADAQKTRPLPPDALFSTASVDKPMMKACVYVLEARRQRCPDGRPFTRHTRAFPLIESSGIPIQVVDERIRDITIEHLMEMRSGLPNDVGWFQLADDLGRQPKADLAALAQWSAKQRLRYLPGAEPPPGEYSNLNSSLMKLILDRLTGDLIKFYREEILAPAGSRDCFLGRSRPEDRHPREAWLCRSGELSRAC